MQAPKSVYLRRYHETGDVEKVGVATELSVLDGLRRSVDNDMRMLTMLRENPTATLNERSAEP